MEGTLAAFGGSKLVKQPSGQRAGGAMIGAQRVLAARRRPLTAGSVAANTAPQRIVRHRSPSFAIVRHAARAEWCRLRSLVAWLRAAESLLRLGPRTARQPVDAKQSALCSPSPSLDPRYALAVRDDPGPGRPLGPNPGWRARVACMRHQAGGI
jgi:hypothetical protein